MKKLVWMLPLLAACSTPYHPPQFVEADAHFPGLERFVREAPQHKVDVLLVHGMCTHDTGWAVRTVQELATALAANAAPASDGALAAGGARTGGQVEIIPAIVRTGEGEIRFQSLIWSPLTTPLKQQLCYDQTDKSAICQGTPPYTPQRAGINAKVKDWLLDDCLPDALIYQGVARDTIQSRMRDAIERATAAAPEAPLLVISESLGSKILFDTLSGMLDDPAHSRAALRMVDRLAFLAMAANQIPLLHLADQDVPGPVARRAVPGDSLQRILALRRTRTAAALAPISRLTLVAFSDPNDLLSYTLLREKYAGENVEVVNVLVSNATTYFGAFERPDAAHLNYLSNPDVTRLIVQGK